jgi:hypothetical protein
MPPLAREKSRAGAKAFVRHYIDVLNYSWATGTGSALTNLSHKQCVSCRGLANFIDEVYAAGGYQRGGEWRVAVMALVPGTVDGAIVATPAIDVLPGRWKESADTHATAIEPHRIHYEFRVGWSNGQWRMRDIVS